MRNSRIWIILALGLLLRLPWMHLPGTQDVDSFRMWGALALRSGLLRVYTWEDQDVLNAIFLKRHGVEIRPRTTNVTDIGPAIGVPDYPPGNILFLELSVGLGKFLQGGNLRAGPLLNACLNLWPALFALAASLFIWFIARRENAPCAVGAIAAFWLNPVLILASPVLGYQDPIFAFFGLLALVSFHYKKPALSALCLALSCLIKPQGVFLIPVLAAANWAEGGWRMLGRFSTRFLLFLLVALMPYILAGRLLMPSVSILRNTIFPALSAQTANVWWLVGPALEAIAGQTLTPLAGRIQMVPQSEFRALTGFDPLWISLPALLAFTAGLLHWLVRQLRAGNRHAIYWAAALQVYGYTMLALFVHENHLYAFFVYAAPLLALGCRPAWRLFAALSVVFGLNLYLFDGLGMSIEAGNEAVRHLLGVDLSIFLSVSNLMIFAWLVYRGGRDYCLRPKAAVGQS